MSSKTNIFWNGERFVLSANSFSLRTDIDCFYDSLDNKMYILNRKYFEDIFNFKTYHIEKAKLCLDKIDEQDIFSQNEVFRNICLNDYNLIMRLSKMELSGDLVLFEEHITEIKSLIEEDNLDIYFNANNKIQIDENISKETIRHILSLINDEYLTSRITKKNYVASTKQLSMMQRLLNTLLPSS